MSNLLSLGQVDPQLPPGREFLPVTEVVRHFLAGIPGHQRGAVLHELVGSLHARKTRCCPLKNERSPPTHTYTHRHTHTSLLGSCADCSSQHHMEEEDALFLRQYKPAYGVRSDGRPVNGVRQSGAATSPLNCLNCLWRTAATERSYSNKSAPTNVKYLSTRLLLYLKSIQRMFGNVNSILRDFPRVRERLSPSSVHN